VTVTCECTRGRRCAMRACRCTMQAIARRYSTTVRIGCAPPPFAPRKHGARRQHTHMHAHNPTYRCEQPRTQVKRRGGCEPGARQESRWTAAEGPRQTVGAAGVHVCGSCHVNSTREHIHADTHTHTQGRDAGAGRESSGVAKGARTLSGSRAEDCEHDRGRGGVACSCCHR
jgi:hypothetical protein